MKMTKTIISIIIAIFACSNLYSQTNSQTIDTTRIKYKNPEGTEFWLCFEKNFNENKGDSLFLELFFSGNEDASVVVEIDGLKYIRNIFVPSGTVANIKLPVEAQVVSEEIIERLAVHVTSNKPISVYGLNRRKQTTDTYLGLPTSVLGTEYRVMCYTLSEQLMPQFAIVATEDSTSVTIITTVNTTKHPAKYPYKIYLNKGDVYQVIANYESKSNCDLTGSYIKATKPVAVFSGHQCAYVTPRIIACNHLVEQMPPLSSWGKHFYIGLLQPRSVYTYRVLANEPDTKIFEDNILIKTLNAGEFHEANSRKNIQISANRPVLVAQYSQGFRNGDSIGDPMMILISPTQQFLKQYRFATPINGEWRHYVNVVVPTKAIRTLKLNGNEVDSARFSQLGISRYSIAYIEIPFGSHKLEADLPFGMYSYGFGFKSDAFDAYGTMGGQSFVDYEPIPDTLAPMVEEEIKGNMIKIIARDDRTDDSGLKRIEVTMSEGLKFNIPKIEEGMPQAQFSVVPASVNTEGKALITIYDAAANAETYTVCYVFDANRGRNVFMFAKGLIAECKPDPGVEIGLFIRPTLDIHSIDLSKTSNYQFIGKFGSESFVNNSFGLYLSRRFFEKINLSATISLEKYSGSLEAFGKIDSIRDENTMLLKPYQQSQTLELTGYNLHLDTRAEYYFNTTFYGLGGFDFAFNFSADVTIKDKIIQPNDNTFLDKTREHISPNAPTNLSEIPFLRASLLLGGGANIPIINGFTAFAEIQYYLPVISLLSDSDWYLHRLAIMAGIKYRLYNFAWSIVADGYKQESATNLIL